jgi:hypothetical protein
MRSIIVLVLVCSLLAWAGGKSVDKVIRLREFPSEGPFIFLTKLHIAAG